MSYVQIGDVPESREHGEVISRSVTLLPELDCTPVRSLGPRVAVPVVATGTATR